MAITALVVLLFLLGFGSMIISHAHREIHLVPMRVSKTVGVFIVFFSAVLILYLTGQLFSRAVIRGENPFTVGSESFKALFAGSEKGLNNDSAVEKSLESLNQTLQRQAMEAANDKRFQLEKQLGELKTELKQIKSKVSPAARTASRRNSTLYTRKRSTAVRTAKSQSIDNLINYDPAKYTPDTEPVLNIPVERD